MKNEVTILDKTFVESITSDRLKSRIAELGKEVGSYYEGADPLILSVLNGSFLFTADFLRSVPFDPEIYFIRVSSYAGGMTSTGTVKEISGFTESVEGRDILLVEDIVDTGHTLDWLRKNLKGKGAASVKIVSLLFKEEAYGYPEPPEFVGFTIPNIFVVGYGLDYNQRGRNLGSVYQLKA